MPATTSSTAVLNPKASHKAVCPKCSRVGNSPRPIPAGFTVRCKCGHPFVPVPAPSPSLDPYDLDPQPVQAPPVPVPVPAPSPAPAQVAAAQPAPDRSPSNWSSSEFLGLASWVMVVLAVVGYSVAVFGFFGWVSSFDAPKEEHPMGEMARSVARAGLVYYTVAAFCSSSLSLFLGAAGFVLRDIGRNVGKV